MNERPHQNVVVSIHQRLLNVSKKSNRSFNDLVLYYAIERFLYRISKSTYADRVVLKGGLMLNVWNVPATRVTRDIDLLGRLGNDFELIGRLARHVCGIKVEEDGLFFDPETVRTVGIAEDADYEGVRVNLKGHFGKVSLAMQIDFGFSDVITPEPQLVTYPSILEHPPAQLLAYNRETAVAEKFEAMVKLGELNSRMKDFFDVWVLAQNFSFDGRLLAEAIQSTFTRRLTEIEIEPVCFMESFANMSSKAAQWKGFLRTSSVTSSPADFLEVIAIVRQFLQPIAHALADRRDFTRDWPAGGSWR